MNRGDKIWYVSFYKDEIAYYHIERIETLATLGEGKNRAVFGWDRFEIDLESKTLNVRPYSRREVIGVACRSLKRAKEERIRINRLLEIVNTIEKHGLPAIVSAGEDKINLLTELLKENGY